jgi:alkaline phosphatase
MTSSADRDQDPLLVRDEIDREEEQGLLGGDRVDRNKPGRWRFWKDCGLFTWAILATIAVAILAVSYSRLLNKMEEPVKPQGKRNLIFMVSDGMGPTSLALTRSYKQFSEGLPWGAQLGMEKYLIGQSRTRSSSSLVTDSAAGATAFSCGFKSYNGAISVLDDKTPCGTVLEAAKKAGYMTGLVVTTRLTDATPACFASHVFMRSEEDRIAEQLIGDNPLGRVVDLFFGGGRCHFLPNTTVGSCRADGKDIVEKAKERGFSYGDSRGDFDALRGGEAIHLPYLGLYADTDIPYEIDRRNEGHIYPSLDEMTQVALKALSDATKDSEKGFFLMVEGSRIDHAGHANDPAAQVFEVMAYDKAFTTVIDFLDKDPTGGIMVSTSDHETGGLATGRRKHSNITLVNIATNKCLEIHETYPQYLWYPEVL